MIDILYAIFILPIELLMKFILEVSYSITSSYGISLIVLSLVINLIIMPIGILSEYYKSIEKAILNKMQPEIDNIKKYYKGRERHFYIQTIYRRFNYHPMSTFKASLGFLIQIPFFFAAYHFLSNYEVFNGVEFFILSDLSQPDKLFYDINILPFFMTLVSLLSAYLYTAQMDNKEKMQLYGLAVVFLVLLYNEASALLLYWTVNNLFSLIKPFIEKKVSYIFNYLKNIRIFNLKYFLTPYLIIAFFYIFLFAENIEEVIFDQSLRSLFYIILMVTALLLITRYLVKSIFKVNLILSFFVFSFFSFGYLVNLFDLQIRYLFVIYCIFSIVVLIGIFLIKKEKFGFVNFLNGIILTLIFINLVNILLYIDKENSLLKKNNFNLLEDQLLNVKNESISYPDIYYIIPDAFASSDVLKSDYNYNNSSFMNTLDNLGFYNVDNSKSNYSSTFLSLASSLNINYINHLSERIGENSQDRSIPIHMIQNSFVFKYLKTKGYKFINYSSGWGPTNNMKNFDLNVFNYSAFNEFEVLLMNTTLASPFVRRFMYAHANNILNTFEKVPSITSFKNSSKFVLAHILAPHPPYVFNEDGKEVTNSLLKLHGDSVWKEKELYVSQHKFIEKKILALVEKILKTKRDVVIIIQSDHGVGSFSNSKPYSKEQINRRVSNFTSIYLPNQNYNEFYASISPVNIYRLVFNNIYNDSFKILDDKSYYSSYSTPYKFSLVEF